jgi:hypothetical protein
LASGRLLALASPKSLTSEQFSELFEDFGTSAFRLECRDGYDVAEEADLMEALSQGRLTAAQMDSRPWVDLVRRATSEGKDMSRVHVVSKPLTPYTRFEINWAYPSNERAGERVAIVDRKAAEELFPDGTPDDYWLFDDQVAVLMDYDAAGRFQGAARVTDPASVERLREVKVNCLRAATPLVTYQAMNRPALAEPKRHQGEGPAIAI